MKKLKKKWLGVLLIPLIVALLEPSGIFAAGPSNTNFSLSGSSSVTTGSSFTLDLIATSSDGLNAIDGVVSVADSSCVQIVGLEEPGDTTTVSGSKFVYSSMKEITSAKTLVKINLKAGSSACSTNVIVGNINGGFTSSAIQLENASTSKTITVGAQAPKSNDATLKSLASTSGTISPSFNKDTLTYSMTVESDVTKVTFTASPNSNKATVSGTTCNLSGNTTACKIVVKAEDNTTKEYVVNVTKKAAEQKPDNTNPKPTDPTPTESETPKEEEPEAPKLSNVATLKSLDVKGYTLSPKFSSKTTSYSITVASTVDAIEVSALPTDEKATVEISGATKLKEGVNQVYIKVTAENGSSNIYTVNVNKKSKTTAAGTVTKSNDSYLRDLIVTNGELSPKFSQTLSNYNVTVSNDVDKLELSAIKNNNKAKVEITGNENFVVGNNAVTIKVTAEDGSVRIYTINVIKSEKKSNNKLSALEIEDYPIPFDKDKFEYEIKVDGSVDSLKIKTKAESKNAKVEIIGNKNLKEGNNTVLIKVTDENGFTQYYKIDVEKEAKKGLFGLSSSEWLLTGGALIGTASLLGLATFFIFRKQPNLEQTRVLPKISEKDLSKTAATPVIEFKPEFNFSSKNGTDDDYVSPGGVLNQYSGIPAKEEPKVIEAPYSQGAIEDAKLEEIPYDPYDEVVTKDELYDALEESIDKKDFSKLKMLMEQERLNREKDRLRQYEDRNE